MDSRPDVTRTTGSAHGGNHPPAEGRSVTGDQAIFTSIPSVVGSGYRIVAASRGLRLDEKLHIVTRCPSHQGLCGDGPDAVGVSYFPLPSGRRCVTHTCNAGLEHTGRGGHRVYTRIVVLEPDALDAFGGNPFDVVRALLDAQGPEPDLEPPPVLPPLELEARFAPQAGPLHESVSNLGPAWVAGVLVQLLGNTNVVVLGDFPALPLVEAALLSLPAPLRAELSFSAGLRYSPGRGFALAALDDGNAGRLRQILQGHKVTLLEPGADSAKAPDIDCDWCLMVKRRWESRRAGELFAFTNGEFPNTTLEALQCYGRLCSRRDELDGSGPAALLDLLSRHLDESLADEFATRLAIGITSEAIARLSDFFSTASIEDIRANWETLLGLWGRSESTSSLLGQLTGSVLLRATRLAPLVSAAMAVKLVQNIRRGAPAEPVLGPLGDLLDHLGEWIYDQPAEQLSALAPALQGWKPDDVLGERLAQIKRQLSACLSTAPAGTSNVR